MPPSFLLLFRFLLLPFLVRLQLPPPSSPPPSPLSLSAFLPPPSTLSYFSPFSIFSLSFLHLYLSFSPSASISLPTSHCLCSSSLLLSFPIFLHFLPLPPASLSSLSPSQYLPQSFPPYLHPLSRHTSLPSLPTSPLQHLPLPPSASPPYLPSFPPYIHPPPPSSPQRTLHSISPQRCGRINSSPASQQAENTALVSHCCVLRLRCIREGGTGDVEECRGMK